MSELAEALESLAEILEDCAFGDVFDGFALIESDDSGWVTIRGRRVFIGDGTGTGAPSKSDLAKLSYRGGDVHEQRIADQTEKELSEHLKMPRTADNQPFDLQSRKIGVEIKTLVSNSNDKITMNREARERKEALAKEKKLRTFTVVVDKRVPDQPRYFVKPGFGSFRIGSMKEMPNMKAIGNYVRKTK